VKTSNYYDSSAGIISTAGKKSLVRFKNQNEIVAESPSLQAEEFFFLLRFWVMPQFENSIAITPKAFANFSPGLERSDNPGIITSKTF